jgi:hypothetical protein
LANVHKAREDSEKGNYGEEIGRFYLAKEHVKRGLNCSNVNPDLVERLKVRLAIPSFDY